MQSKPKIQNSSDYGFIQALDEFAAPRPMAPRELGVNFYPVFYPMSIFSKIMTKVFAVYPEAELKRSTEQVITDKQRADLHKPVETAPAAASATATSAPFPAETAPAISLPSPDVAPTGGATVTQVSAPAAAVPQAAPVQQVDVAASLDKLAKENPEDLDWKKSIVDLLKLIDMDSSLHARKELADELGYPGDKSDSATMNEWLHKQVLVKLSENGGKVPASLIA